MNLISWGSVTVLFAAAVLVGLVGRRFVPALLLVASVAFYVASASGGLPWLILSTVVAFSVGKLLPTLSPPCATWAIGGSIGLIVGALVLVKLPGGSLAAPLGISYFSFRLIAYLLEVYWGRTAPAPSAVSFVAFVAYFPQISSGPIQRWEDFDSQIGRFELPDHERLVAAMRLILFGLFKKIVVANRLGAIVDPVFGSPGACGPWMLVAAAYAFPIQLYADFSGLTDIARGASRLLGIEAPRNFDKPFLSMSVQEFWSRWHMSLTFWLRDYLFKPLSATLRHQGRIGVAIAITVNMVAIGLWHGLQWTFLAFGTINAIYLMAGALRPQRRRSPVRIQSWRRVGGVLLTFNLMTFAFVFFRAADLSVALGVLSGFPALLHVGVGATQAAAPSFNVTPRGAMGPVAAMAVAEFLVARGYWDRWFVRPRFGGAARWVAYYAVVLAIVFGGLFNNTRFIYARF
jgi:D-alanyl-lipoteichoic acid acyltransferase DltB (MBOAT superfamily)